MLILEQILSALLLGAVAVFTTAYIRHVFYKDAEWRKRRNRRKQVRRVK